MGLIDDIKNLGKAFVRIGKVLLAALKLFPNIIFLFEKFALIFTKPHLLIFLWVQIYIYLWCCIFYLFWVLFLKYVFHIYLLFVFSGLNLFMFMVTIIFFVFVSFWDCSIFRGWLYPLFYRFIGATENSPDGWLLSNGYHHQNKNKRIFGLSRYKCQENYIPDASTSNLFCKRISSDQFSYCPIANIQKEYFYGETKGRYSLKPFDPGFNFMNKSSAEKEIIINAKKASDRHEMDHCNTYTKNTKPLSKLICRASEFNIGDNSKIDGICAETFCTNGNWDQFCSKMNIKHINRKEIDTINMSVTTSISEKIYFSVLIIVFMTLMSNVMINKFKNIL